MASSVAAGWLSPRYALFNKYDKFINWLLKKILSILLCYQINMKIYVISCLLFFLSVLPLQSMEIEHEKKMDIIEAVVRSLIFGPPRAYPKHPTHFAITLPEGFTLEELRTRIPDSPLPLISEQEIDFRIRPCRLKSTGEAASPRSIDFTPWPRKSQKPTVLLTDTDTAKVWLIDGDKCFSDGKGGWFFLGKTSGNWQVVNVKWSLELD